MTPMTSPTAKASSWSCVTSSAVVPLSFRITRTSCARRSRRSTSRLEKGSSSSSSRGCGASARASATRCCWPPDSSCGARLAACARPTRSSICCTRWLRAPRGQPGDAEGHVVGHAQVREQRVVLEHHADAALLGRQVQAGGGVGQASRRPSRRARRRSAPARPRRAAARSCRSPRARSARRSCRRPGPATPPPPRRGRCWRGHSARRPIRRLRNMPR